MVSPGSPGLACRPLSLFFPLLVKINKHVMYLEAGSGCCVCDGMGCRAGQDSREPRKAPGRVTSLPLLRVTSAHGRARGTGAAALAQVRLPVLSCLPLLLCPAPVQVSCLAESQRRNLARSSRTLKTLATCVSCWGFPLLFCWSWSRPAGLSLGRSAWPQPRAAGAQPARRFSSFSLSWEIYLCHLCFLFCSLFMVFPLSPQAGCDHHAGAFRRGPEAVDGGNGWPGTGEQKY